MDVSGSDDRAKSPSLLNDVELKCAPILTCPSPDVRARSVNDGPNVVVVRASRPVEGSSLKMNPPDDVASGWVAISVVVVRAIASPTPGAAPFDISERTCCPVRPGTTVTFWARAGLASARTQTAIGR